MLCLLYSITIFIQFVRVFALGFILTYLVIISFIYCNAQTCLTTKDGLLSDRVYQVMQDQSGFMWFATEAGVSKYNGYSFQHFTVSDGLPSNDILSVWQDYMGNIWFVGVNQELSVYNGDSIKPFKLPKPFDNTPLGSGCMAKDGSYWFANRSGRRFFHLIGDSLVIFALLGEDSLVNPRVFSAHNGDIWITDENKVGVINDTGISVYKILSNQPLSGSFERIVTTIFPVSKTQFYFGTSNALFHYKNNITIKVWPKTTAAMDGSNWLFSKLSDSTFLAANKDVCYIIDNTGKILEAFNADTYLGKSVLDNENNLWLPTFGKGVKLLTYNERYIKASFIGMRTTALAIINDSILLFGLANQQLGLMKTNFLEQTVVQPSIHSYGLKEQTTDRIFFTDIKELGSTVSLASNIGLYRLSKSIIDSFRSNDSLLQCSMQKYNISNAALKQLMSLNDTLFIAASNGLYSYPLVSDSFQLVRHSKMSLTSMLNTNNALVVGTRNGLSYLDKTFDIDTTILTNKCITALAVDSANNLWVGTDSYGLYWVDRSKKSIRLDLGEQFENLHVNDLLLNDSILFIGSNQGVMRVTFSLINDEIQLNSIGMLDTKDGIIDNEVNRLQLNNNNLYISTASGINKLNLSKIEWSHRPPQFYLTKVVIENENFPITTNYSLEVDNLLEISYSAISYFSKGDIEYAYRLKGYDNDWHHTKERTITYNLLPVGDFLLEIKASNSYGNWSTPVSLRLTIVPPIWQRPLFYLSILLLSISITLLLAYWRIQVIKEKQIEKTETNKRIAEFKLKALHAQMNPHFVFNALHSIQSYMFENDSVNAGLYLMKFAKLMRLTLESSIKPSISLDEEISALTLYLELEILRFGNDVSYTIKQNIKEPIEEILLPSMILQPFVENAIVHGVANNTGKREIKLTFESKGDYLTCVIENLSEQTSTTFTKLKKRTSYPSRSLGIIDNKIDTLKELHEVDITITSEVIDEARRFGTRIIVVLKKLK